MFNRIAVSIEAIVLGDLIAQPVVVGNEDVQELVQPGVENVLDRADPQPARGLLDHVVTSMAQAMLLGQQTQARSDIAVTECKGARHTWIEDKIVGYVSRLI